MTVEEEIKFQTKLINERLRNVQIYKLAIEALIGEIPEKQLSLLLDITKKINEEQSGIELSDNIIKNLEIKEAQNGKSI